MTEPFVFNKVKKREVRIILKLKIQDRQAICFSQKSRNPRKTSEMEFGAKIQHF